MELDTKMTCVRWFLECKSPILVQRKFRRIFKLKPPSASTLRRWKTQFEETGDLTPKPVPNRPTLPEATVRLVREAFEKCPNKSLREVSRELSLPRTTVSKYKPYIESSDTNAPKNRKSKRNPLRGTKAIGTHDGTFHCDEVFACAMLQLLPEYKSAVIVRSRDQKILDTCNIVVDVGGVYDPSKHRYDHHQRAFSESMHTLIPEKPWVTKLSSAGLIYVHFGQRIIKEIVGASSSEELLTNLYDKIYENFVEEIDAIDNGIAQSDEKPRYLITTNLSTRIANLNPSWNVQDVDVKGRFDMAVDLVRNEFLDRVLYYSKSWWPARALVKESIEKCHEVDASKQIIELSNGGQPWKDHLFAIEAELKLNPTIKYVIFTDQNGSWRIQCVPVNPHSFELRLPLPEPWRGLRDEELSQAAGIPGCVFVHSAGFIGGHKTRVGALLMALESLKFPNILDKDKVNIPVTVKVIKKPQTGKNSSAQ